MSFAKNGRAISPIIATVLIIAVTLIASVAIGASSSASSPKARTPHRLPSQERHSYPRTSSLADDSPIHMRNGVIRSIPNSDQHGSGSASVATVSLTWAGDDQAYSLSGSCTIGGSSSTTSTTYIIFPSTTQITPSALSGQSYTGTVMLSNGAQLPFTGTWQ